MNEELMVDGFEVTGDLARAYAGLKDEDRRTCFEIEALLACELEPGVLAPKLDCYRVANLRQVAKGRGIGTGIWRAQASKDDLVRALSGGGLAELAPPQPVVGGNGHAVHANGNGHQHNGHADLAKVIAEAVGAHLHIEPPAAALDEDKVAALVDERVFGPDSKLWPEMHEKIGRAVLSTEQVRKLVRDEVGQTVRRIEVVLHGNKSGKVLERTHRQFEDLLDLVACGQNVWLAGPAGSGKSHAAEQVAEALGMEFYSFCCNGQQTLSSLKGYMDAHGNYVRTALRDAYENGGLLLLDEVDGGGANIQIALNAPLSGSWCEFPDKMVRKHPDFHVVATANTHGTGQDRVYVGRFQQDGTTLDRFHEIEWGYDEDLELALGPVTEWTRLVQAYRKASEALKVRMIVSPRASIEGGAVLVNSRNRNDVALRVLNARVLRGSDQHTASKVTDKVQSSTGRTLAQWLKLVEDEADKVRALREQEAREKAEKAKAAAEAEKEKETELDALEVDPLDIAL